MDLNFLNEAEFKRENIAKVMQLYRKLFGKYFGGEFKIIAEEEYAKQGEKGTGIRLMNDLNYQLRFNWKQRESNALLKKNKSDKTKLYISSIDYWEPTNLDFEKPSTTVNFLFDINVVQIWRGLAKVIKKGIRGKYTLNDLKVEPSDLKESSSGSKFIQFLNESPFKNWGQQSQFLNSQGMENMNVRDFKKLYAEDPELAAKADAFAIEIGVGKKETNSTGAKLRQADKDLESQVYCDPEFVFKDIEDLTEFVAKGKAKSLIICGQAGVGKTFHVTSSLEKMLGSAGMNWHYHSGTKASPVAFYVTTFKERNETIVWDEADSLLKNDDIIMMLKPGLDTSGSNYFEYMRGHSMSGWSERDIESYCQQADAAVAQGKILAPVPTKGDYFQIPSKFKFKGQMIFISNMPANKIESAILSRSLYIDVKLASQDVSKRIMSIMKSKYKGLSEDEINEFADALGGFSTNVDEPVTYMSPEVARKIKPLSVRSMVLAIELKNAGLKNWKRLASLYA